MYLFTGWHFWKICSLFVWQSISHFKHYLLDSSTLSWFVPFACKLEKQIHFGPKNLSCFWGDYVTWSISVQKHILMMMYLTVNSRPKFIFALDSIEVLRVISLNFSLISVDNFSWKWQSTADSFSPMVFYGIFAVMQGFWIFSPF